MAFYKHQTLHRRNVILHVEVFIADFANTDCLLK